MQYVALSILLRKLGLSKEYQRARLVSNDREVLRLMEELTTCRNNRELEKAKTILNQMKERVLDDVPENRQYIMEAEASLDWLAGAITEEEFAVREEEALRCTLKVDDLYQMDEVYLTEMEMLCICKRIQILSDAEKRKCIDFIVRIFERYEINNALSDCISIYDFLIIYVICELGNLKEYQKSTDLGKRY